MPIIKTRTSTIIASLLLIFILITLFCLSIYFYIKIANRNSTVIIKRDSSINISYNQVVRSKQNSEQKLDYYKSGYDGKTIFWSGKISTYYSQITGIKFCITDEAHPDVDIDSACDWFWASSDKIMGADDTRINPNWNGNWVDYTLNYYQVEFDKTEDFYNYTYWIKGFVKGIDCISRDQCVPDIDIISIIGLPGPFSKLLN